MKTHCRKCGEQISWMCGVEERICSQCIVSKIYAYWLLKLIVDCPFCDTMIDILDLDPELISDVYGVEVCESGTDRTKDYEVTCPKCGKEFTCDFVY